MLEEIVALAAMLGKTEESEELTALCKGAVEELTAGLREGIGVEDCGGAFPLAAAWLALAGMAAEDGVTSFTAGDMSVKKSGGGARREALRLQARQVMRPYLRDEGFAFRGVKG